MKLPKHSRVLTAIVGSYPKPHYLYGETGRKRELLDSFSTAFSANSEAFSPAEFNRLLDKAALKAISDQDQAGIDLVTDGEERRSHYVLSVVAALGGIDMRNLRTISIRGGVSRRAPTVVDRISYQGAILLNEYRFTSQHTRHTPKIGLPGPTTVVDCLADSFYDGDKARLANDYATAIRSEVEALIKEGCRVIQFDDPVLLRDPTAAKAWGLKALERCFAGLENKATFIVHICRGYPDKALERRGVEYKANKHYYRDVLSWLSSSQLDVVSIEGAQSDLDLSILPAIGTKTVMLGVLDVGNERVESVEELVKRGEEALQYLPPDQLILAPDCGMIEITAAASGQKLQHLAASARQLSGAGKARAALQPRR